MLQLGHAQLLNQSSEIREATIDHLVVMLKAKARSSERIRASRSLPDACREALDEALPGARTDLLGSA